MNVFPVVAELKDPSTKRTNLVSKYSMLVCLVIYSIGGSFGFFAFEGNAKSDVIQVRFVVKMFNLSCYTWDAR